MLFTCIAAVLYLVIPPARNSCLECFLVVLSNHHFFLLQTLISSKALTPMTIIQFLHFIRKLRESHYAGAGVRKPLSDGNMMLKKSRKVN
jgi:hypothetical protein